jgi:hypothetical protein
MDCDADAHTSRMRISLELLRGILHVGSRCGAKGKVQVYRQVKLLPAPQLLPESAGLDTTWAG